MEECQVLFRRRCVLVVQLKAGDLAFDCHLLLCLFQQAEVFQILLFFLQIGALIILVLAVSELVVPVTTVGAAAV